MTPSAVDLAGLLSSRRRLALFLDYDGTLVPFQDDPAKAVPDESLLRLLERLGKDPRLHLVIVSGRAANDLQRLLGGSVRHLLALHGAQYVGPEGLRVDRADLSSCRRRLRPVVEACSPLLASVRCARLEDKGAAVSLHTRGCDREGELRAIRWFEDLSREATESGEIALLHGSRVMELKPAAADKGSGALWLLERFGTPWFPVYVGDDATDEDGFRALKDRGETILVGPAGRSTAARHRLDDPAAVRRFLERIAPDS